MRISIRTPSASQAMAVFMLTCWMLIGSRSMAGESRAAPLDHGSVDLLWARDNLFAWCVAPYDARQRGPGERARMLAKLGFRSFAYDWLPQSTSTFDAQIEALKEQGVNLLAWWFPLDPQDELAKTILEIFKHHGVHPQLWVPQSYSSVPKTPEDWAKLLPKGMVMPQSQAEFASLSDANKAEVEKTLARLQAGNFPKTPQEQVERVRREADRIYELVKLAAPYGSKVELYNHNGWFGLMDNQLAIIGRLRELGITDVGIVYNFSHARDDVHDDTVKFSEIWKKIKRYVVAINVTGTTAHGTIYPSQGDRELQMMRIIQDSGWHGPVGLIAEKGGDAEVTLGNDLVGLDWLAAQLRQPGSGGPRPAFPAD